MMDNDTLEPSLHVEFAKPGDLTEASTEEFAQVLVESVFDSPPSGIIGYYRHEIQELLNKGQLVVGKLDDRVAGMVGFEKWWEFDGREVYELSKGSVLNEYQGRGYYNQLKGFIVAYLKKEHPDALVVGFSRNPRVVKQGEKHFPGMQLLPLSSDHPIAAEFRSRCSKGALDDMIRRGVKILLYDLKEM